MASRLSPGGALLRGSRMFSIPKPIPALPGDVTGIMKFQSPTATAPYPSHLAITTPESSRGRGDWGLKRPLPLRNTTRSSTPVIRVKDVDSIDHITDYASAADHAISLQKFQELNVHITVPNTQHSLMLAPNAGTKSVFEEDVDITATEPGHALEIDKRWKFRGPWLAGLTEGEFNRFVNKKVRNKRQAFRFFLKNRLAQENTAIERQKSLDNGKEAAPQLLEKDITDEQLTEYIRKLRSDRVGLYSLVGEFLDLAPLSPPSALTTLSSTSAQKPLNPYAKDGPPITHPSAGLSYLRTTSYADNHPVYGPQAHHAPVMARIVSPRFGAYPAKLGVGGFITDTPAGDTAFNYRSFAGGRKPIAGVARLDPDIRGGAKAFVQPLSAKLDSSGRVAIRVGEANEEAEMIYKEMVGRAKIYNNNTEPEPVTQTNRFTDFRQVSNSSAAIPRPALQRGVPSSSRNYGLEN